MTTVHWIEDSLERNKVSRGHLDGHLSPQFYCKGGALTNPFTLTLMMVKPTKVSLNRPIIL